MFVKNIFKSTVFGFIVTCFFVLVPRVGYCDQYIVFSEQCKKGNGEAQRFFKQAQNYRFGRGVTLNIDFAKSRYSEALMNGSTRALYDLGTLKESELRWDQNNQKLKEEAINHFRQAANAGCPEGIYKLYLWDDHQKNINLDFPNSRLVEAAEGGAMVAMAELGSQYIRKNQIDEGVKWLKKAIDLGYGAAATGYSRIMFEQGRISEAMDALFSGARAGSLISLQRLAWIYSRGLHSQVHDPVYAECLNGVATKIISHNPPEPIPNLDQLCSPS